MGLENFGRDVNLAQKVTNFGTELRKFHTAAWSSSKGRIGYGITGVGMGALAYRGHEARKVHRQTGNRVKSWSKYGMYGPVAIAGNAIGGIGIHQAFFAAAEHGWI